LTIAEQDVNLARSSMNESPEPRAGFAAFEAAEALLLARYLRWNGEHRRAIDHLVTQTALAKWVQTEDFAAQLEMAGSVESREAIHSQVCERRTFLGLVLHHIAAALPASVAKNQVFFGPQSLPLHAWYPSL